LLHSEARATSYAKNVVHEIFISEPTVNLVSLALAPIAVAITPSTVLYPLFYE